MLEKILKLLENIILKGKIYIPRKIIKAIAFYVVPLVLFIIYLIPNIHIEFQEDLGSIAYYLFLIVVFIKPIKIIFKKIKLFSTVGSYRRELGLATFYFALFHFLFYTKVVQTPIWELYTFGFTTYDALTYGSLSLTILFILAITSNKFSTIKLKRNWKKLHRIVYIALPLILIHVAMIEGESLTTPILITLLYFALKYWERNITKQK